jgi:putative oxidoreductase
MTASSSTLSSTFSTRTDRNSDTVSPARALLSKLVATDRDPAATVARVALGAILFPHGAQHALGWFGGYGFSGTLGWMTGALGIPAPVAAFSIVVELVAPVLMILGLGGRVTALALMGFMAVAGSTHLANGFFMNWFGQAGAGVEGFEYHLLAIALGSVVAIKGMGAYSADRALFPKQVTSAAS